MADKRKNQEEVYAVLRYETDCESDTSIENRITVKGIVRSIEMAEAEVTRLNQLNAEKGCHYFYQYSRLFSEEPSHQGKKSTEPLSDNLPESSVESEPKQSKGISVITCVTICHFIFLAFLLNVVPKFSEMFSHDGSLEYLPPLTQYLFVCHQWFWVTLIFPMSVIGLVLGLRKKKMTKYFDQFATMVFLFYGAVACWAVMALFLPLVGSMENLGPSPH